MAGTSPRGPFLWYELATTDAEAAQSFYTDVVGWTTAPFADAAIPYTMWMKGVRPVGGVMELPEKAREGGAPPHWLAYVAVPDVDQTAAHAEELGATILMGPQDIPNVGRFAILRDPQGAVIAAFKAVGEMSSEDSDPEPGDFSWNELATSDHEAAFDFYSDLFGWEKSEALDMGEAGVYQMYGRRGRMLGGMFNKTAVMPEPDRNRVRPGPPAWLYYIRVVDLDEALRKVEMGGGKVVNGPMEVPGGSRIAQCQDPQGAFFALHQRPSS